MNKVAPISPAMIPSLKKCEVIENSKNVQNKTTNEMIEKEIIFSGDFYLSLKKDMV